MSVMGYGMSVVVVLLNLLVVSEASLGSDLLKLLGPLLNPLLESWKFEPGRGCIRVASAVDIGHCGIPFELSNFQGLHECNAQVAIVRPKTIDDIQRAVKKYDKVKAVGTGLSWWKRQFCSGNDSSSANIAMTELANIRQLFTSATVTLNTSDGSPDFPIKVDMDKMQVTVDGGVPLRTLFHFLRNQRSQACPHGCYVAMTPQMIDVTVAGAMASGTHGSSAQHATWSSQVVAVEVVLADGSIRTFTKEGDPHLFRALQVNVGRLGIVTKLTVSIIPEPTLKRTRYKMKPEQAVDMMVSLQENYKAAKISGTPENMKTVMDSVKNMLVLWFKPVQEVWWIQLEEVPPISTPGDHGESTSWNVGLMEALDPVQRTLHGLSTGIKQGKQLPPDGDQQLATSPLHPNPLIEEDELAGLISKAFMILIDYGLGNLTAPSYYSIPTTRPEWLIIWAALTTPMNEYEACVPLERAGDAMKAMLKVVTPQFAKSFRTPTGFRFVNEEPAYLAGGAGGPRICVEVDDFNGPSQNKSNANVERIVQILMDHGGRLHWSKFGWEHFEQCFDGAAKWGDNWCHFGCAVHELDPRGKFKSESHIWNWTASNAAGNPRDFAGCCGPQGFMKSAECVCGVKGACPDAPKSNPPKPWWPFGVAASAKTQEEL